ncbi:hypothetical protein Bca52824_085010 [Brassica carinata]|uniref:Uncharacterized protein n=1 Tax=Brassica carinata TaxID=52824 RepID=A0A8X7PSI4_BRACI|nr:hypothetical protein Bca52824_085010 [Brassica carinata]
MAMADVSGPQLISTTGDADSDQIIVPENKSWKNFFAYLGPGFLVSIAYIDPGNFETDLQAGAQYKYELLWIILVASCAGLVIQSLAANLGVVTGKHLAEHCRAEYSKVPNFLLWVVAEIAIVACDIPEGTKFLYSYFVSIISLLVLIILGLLSYIVIGTAFALNMLFSIPIWIGVLLTGLSTLMLLALQQYGVRKLEFLVAFLVFTIAICFVIELHYSKPDAGEVLHGLFVPQLKGNGATGLAISLLGAMVMPHNLFLHSALVLSRKIPRSSTGIKEACRFYLIESGLALMVAFLINVSVISVSGAVCNASDLTPEDRAKCEDLDLNKASFLLRNVVGKWSSKLFAIALLASGQSSTMTGTYAGQYIMQGFLDLRLVPWLRNFLTRCLAIIPSLIVALIGGSAGAGKLIIIASMILSFELPFALVPLLKFTSCKIKMGSHVNHMAISALTWVIGGLIMGINIYYIVSSFTKLLIHSHMKHVLVVFCGIIGFSGIAIYLASIAYLVFRKNGEAGPLLASTNSQTVETLPRQDIVDMQFGKASTFNAD